MPRIAPVAQRSDEGTEAVDPGRLTPWLVEHGLAAAGAGPVEVRPLGEGHSNLTFLVTIPGAESLVLRRPPLGPLLPTAPDVLREDRILRLLGPAGVRCPQPVAAEADPGVLGAPFILQARSQGLVLRGAAPAWVDPTTGPQLAHDFIDALVEIHVAPVEPVVAAGIGRPGGYLERQVRRWIGQREGLEAAVAAAGSTARPLPDYEIVRDWLRARLPAEQAPAVVHGDYKLDNVLVVPPEGSLPPRVSAILDWEMATVGDPRADLGYTLSFWPEPGEEVVFDNLLTRSEHFPPRDELVERWALGTSRAPDDIEWFRVLALWKLAILLEVSYYRWLAGTTSDPFFARLEAGVPALLAQARQVAGA